MRHYLNIGHCQFDLFLLGVAQQITGKMIHADGEGCIILQESTGIEHAYSWSVIQHITLAP